VVGPDADANTQAVDVVNSDVESAWVNIGNSGYAHDAGVHDPTGMLVYRMAWHHGINCCC
jgi:hypothetical protein